MSDEIKHECAVALVVLRKDAEHYRAKYGTGDFGGTKLSLLLEKQHNRGQDGAGAAILTANPEPGEAPYQIFKSASDTPLADVLGKLARRNLNRTSDPGLWTSLTEDQCPKSERIFLGHLRYATFGKNDVAFCHPFIHEASELGHTLLLAGNFNLTNAPDLFDDYRRHGSFPTSKADGYLICELISKELAEEGRRNSGIGLQGNNEVSSPKSEVKNPIAAAISRALANADGAWTLAGASADGIAFATRDVHGIRPGWYYVDDDVVAVASERPAIQAAFDVPPEEVKELPPGEVLIVSLNGEVSWVPSTLNSQPSTLNPPRPCAFERI